MKPITECIWFGMSGNITNANLRFCGCERCLQEIEQAGALAALRRAYANKAETTR